MKKDYVTASEIYEFVFCPRAYYLKRVRGMKRNNSSLVEGRVFHELMRRELDRASGRGVRVWVLLFLLALLLLSLLMLWH